MVTQEEFKNSLIEMYGKRHTEHILTSQIKKDCEKCQKFKNWYLGRRSK